MYSDAQVIEDFNRFCLSEFEGKATCVIEARAVELPDAGTVYEMVSFRVMPADDYTIQNGQLKGTILRKGREMRGGRVNLIYHARRHLGRWENSKAFIEKLPSEQ